jgi:hypothetical protein
MLGNILISVEVKMKSNSGDAWQMERMNCILLYLRSALSTA